MCILNSEFGPITAFNLFKRFGKPGMGGCALVCLVQHPALSLLSSTHSKEVNTLIVAHHRSPHEKKQLWQDVPYFFCINSQNTANRVTTYFTNLIAKMS